MFTSALQLSWTPVQPPTSSLCIATALPQQADLVHLCAAALQRRVLEPPLLSRFHRPKCLQVLLCAPLLWPSSRPATSRAMASSSRPTTLPQRSAVLKRLDEKCSLGGHSSYLSEESQKTRSYIFPSLITLFLKQQHSTFV
ncbi:hypothetical protein PIB30_059868 [Stylosanthes scabra]|uniref:Uncharacterized protein n=1 Tax=Stylosanthes scabra TaxID=79078 RepID=A0ABU6TL95_9FABA|nr:hypothetical protein [Stylosanthes scabra]